MKPCLKCDYDLTGLPDEHICPECGLDYDPDNVALELARKPDILEVVVALTMLGIVYASFWSGKALGALEDWVSAILVIQIFVLLLMWAVGRGTWRRIIINRLGVHVFRREGQCETVPWEKIESASVSWVTGALKVLGADGGIVLKVSIVGLKKVQHARKCMAEIMRLKELYATREGVSRSAT